MADINFDCPHCNQNLDAPPDMAGESIECPTCGESIGIPAPRRPAPTAGKKIVMKKRTSVPGNTQSSPAPTPRTSEPRTQTTTPEVNVSEKSRLVALLLCFFLGWCGVHRFYVGKVGTGIAQVLTFGGMGIWMFIDFIMIIVGSFSDKTGLPVKNW